MEYHYLLCFVLATLACSAAGKTDIVGAKISVDGTRVAGEVDKNFICATVDLWPHDKCNYNHCPWGFSSAMNLDLSNPLLIKAVKGLNAVRIRMGGSLQDQLVYGVGAEKEWCSPFQRTEDGLFGFSAGCLNTSRWDQLNDFFQYTGAVVTFGLNALHGKRKSETTTARATTVWEGEWDPSNARDFINYTYSKGYPVDSWELGNELCGRGVEARLRTRQYARDLLSLRSVIDSVYSDTAEKPLLVAPGGFYEDKWFAELLQFLRLTGSGVVDVLSHHLYDLGPGDDPSLVGKIVSPDYLNKTAATFADLDQTVRRYGPWASAWVGESGGAYNSGGPNVSDAFVDSFWYLDQLGMSAKYNSKVYCRQSLIGGNYGLIDKNTFLPNPDYYSALLWSQLMGEKVLAVENTGSRFLRTYAHCSKQKRGGVSLLLINLSKESEFVISSNGGESAREEYGLSPKNGNLKSRTMLLNGNPLGVTSENEIPELKPASVDDKSAIKIAPRSIKFVVLPNFGASACA